MSNILDAGKAEVGDPGHRDVRRVVVDTDAVYCGPFRRSWWANNRLYVSPPACIHPLGP